MALPLAQHGACGLKNVQFSAPRGERVGPAAPLIKKKKIKSVDKGVELLYTVGRNAK